MAEQKQHQYHCGNEQAKRAILVKLTRIRAGAQGLSLGLIAAMAIFVATNWLVLKGGDPVGPHLQLLANYFIGYRVTFVGSVIGALYGLVLGFIVGYTIARLYNYFVSSRQSHAV